MSDLKIRSVAKKYDMAILRDPITKRAWGLGLDSRQPIPELEDICSSPELPSLGMAGRAFEVDGTHYYRIMCPPEWFNKTGGHESK